MKISRYTVGSKNLMVDKTGLAEPKVDETAVQISSNLYILQEDLIIGDAIDVLIGPFSALHHNRQHWG